MEHAPREDLGPDAGSGLRVLRCGFDERVNCGFDERIDMHEAGPDTLVGASWHLYFSPELGLIGGCACNDREFAQLSNGRTRNGDCEIQAPSPIRNVFPAPGRHLDIRGQQAGRLLVAFRQVRVPANADRHPPFFTSPRARHHQVVHRAQPAPLKPHRDGSGVVSQFRDRVVGQQARQQYGTVQML